ncbi:MAG: sulfatase-like hydrolase/transferase [Acidobacteriia bacterium]|nr:sulfatase-like hydrolase/transferase [Terriglobia bacterium]
MRARFSHLALFLSAATLLQAQAKPGTTAEPRPRPDVYLITMDTLRADHVGCYGYKRVQTPNLDAVAADGARFTEAFTVSPITNSSHASILTGDYPSTHGVRDFGSPLAAKYPTWAELLKGNGYHTAAFIGAVILDSKALAPGFDRGFDFYDNFPEKAPGKSRWGRVERRGMEVAQRAEDWLRAHRAAPQFVWVHFYDAHDPYEPPAPYSEKYKDHLYDGEIAYADAALGHFLRFLRQQGRYDNALVIIVGDHGEGLGEHREDTHGIFLYDSTTHVPLLIKLPGSARAGRTIAAQVRTTDLLPTVLDVLGIKAPSKFDGTSLKPDLQGSETADRPALAETEYPLHFGWAPLRAARATGFKYIEGPQPELYDLHADPGELHSLYAPWDAKVRELRAMVATLPPLNPTSEGAVGPEKIAELKALGYFPETRGSTTVPEPSLLPDPKDKIEIQNLIHKADLAIEDGRTEEARADLQKAVALDASSAPALSELGQVEIKAADYPQAAEHLAAAVSLRPSDSNALYYLSVARAKAGDQAGAAEALEQSLRLAPTQFEARWLLGEVYGRSGQRKKAADELEAAVLMQPENSGVRLELGRILLEDKEYSAAVRQLEQVTRLQPKNAAAYTLLEQAYRATGNEAEARKAAANAARLGPKRTP